MATYTALTTLAGKPSAEALGEAMERLQPEPTGIGVVDLEDSSGLWEVGGYFTEPPDEPALAVLAAAFGAAAFVVSKVPQTDWVAKVRRELSPVEAGRFFVYGSHDAAAVPGDAVALLIEASMAFGTGHHGTTQGCLLALEDLLAAGIGARRVIDLGCGTAVLAMAAARVWPGAAVLASDIDPVAAEVAEANLAANGLRGRVDCVCATGFDHPNIAAASPFDLVFANILKAPLIALAPDMAAMTAPGGRLILSGILNEQADEVTDVYRAAGYDLVAQRGIVDWTTLTLRRNG